MLAWWAQTFLKAVPALTFWFWTLFMDKISKQVQFLERLIWTSWDLNFCHCCSHLKLDKNAGKKWVEQNVATSLNHMYNIHCTKLYIFYTRHIAGQTSHSFIYGGTYTATFSSCAHCRCFCCEFVVGIEGCFVLAIPWPCEHNPQSAGCTEQACPWAPTLSATKKITTMALDHANHDSLINDEHHHEFQTLCDEN